METELSCAYSKLDCSCNGNGKISSTKQSNCFSASQAYQTGYQDENLVKRKTPEEERDICQHQSNCYRKKDSCPEADFSKGDIYIPNGKTFCVDEKCSQEHEGKYEKDGHCRALRWDEVPSQFREQFIVRGYRKPYTSAYYCLKSAFMARNETANFWTHFIPFLLFIVRFTVLFTSEPFDYYTYPLLCFAVGICGFLLMSSGAHLFNSMSPRTRHVCFFCDYCAISVYSVGAGMAFYSYGRPVADTLSRQFFSPGGYLLGSILISFISTYFCCASRHQWPKYKYIIRTGCFVLAFVFNCSPYLYRAFVEGISSIDPIAWSYFKRHSIFYLIAAIANTTRMPERLMPGVFDIVGHSHNFLHVFTALGVSDQFTAMAIEMHHRRPTLEPLGGMFLSSYSLAMMIVVSLTNVFIVIWFGTHLKSNKEEEHKDL